MDILNATLYIPEDILKLLLQQLPVKTIDILCRTHPAFANICSADDFWQPIAARNQPTIYHPAGWRVMSHRKSIPACFRMFCRRGEISSQEQITLGINTKIGDIPDILLDAGVIQKVRTSTIDLSVGGHRYEYLLPARIGDRRIKLSQFGAKHAYKFPPHKVLAYCTDDGLNLYEQLEYIAGYTGLGDRRS